MMRHITKTSCFAGNPFLRAVVLILLCSFMHQASHAQLSSLTEKISINMMNTTALQVIRELDKQSAYTFSYAQAQLVNIRLATFSYENTTLGKALTNLGAQAGLEFKVSEMMIAVKVTGRPPVVHTTPSAKPGRIVGMVRNEKNEAMAGVSVTVDQLEKGVVTSVTGDYLLTLPPGIYSLLISFVGYQQKRITDVQVKEGEVTDLSVTLTKKDASQLQAVVVTSGARRESVRSLLMAQKNNAAMTNGISAEQIRVTPDNNTAQVLKRVSGITVQNDKFVTIRGVSDRYNNVLINGASLPSTEPNRRNFSFDIVPSQLVDNIVINKTATPDLPSEFTGGLVQINTKDVPAENFLSLTVGTGFNSESTGRDFISYKRDKKAWMGIVDEDRKWFGDGRAFNQEEYVKFNASRDTASMRRVGSRIPTRWRTYRYPYAPTQNYQLSGGVNKPLRNNNMIGVIAALTYLNERLYEEGEARSLQSYNNESKRYKYNTTIGGLLNMAYKSKKHKLAWKNLYNRRYSSQYDDQYGNQIGNGGIENRTGETVLTNRLVHSRLEGEHRLLKAGVRLDWYGDYITLKREQPDGRYLEGRDLDSGSYRYQYNFNDRFLYLGGLYAAVLDEKRHNAGISLNIPFQIGKKEQAFKTGYAWSKRKADFDATGLRILSATNYGESRLGLPYYEIVSQDAIDNGSLIYTPTYVRSGTTGDRYTAQQELQAVYAMLDLKLLNRLRLVGGLRFENNRMTVSTVFYNISGYSEFRDSSYREKSWLPSVNLIYSLTDQLNIRAAYSKTLSRPDFVERSPYVYYDFVEQVDVTGQQGLEITTIKNYDLRFEYYPSGNEIISASLFYKDFDKPVERFYNIGNTSNSVEYKNLYKATAKGFELELRKSLGFVNPGSTWLQNLYISGNYTYLEGTIRYLVTKSPITQKDTFYVGDAGRPIQGLSPYIINAGLNYQGRSWGFNLGFNRFGRRIVNGGTKATLVQFENPRSVLDLQISTRLAKQKAEIRLNISDLLNQDYIIYSNNVNGNIGNGYNPLEGPNNDPKGDAYNKVLDFVNYRVKRGTGFSISINYKF